MLISNLMSHEVVKVRKSDTLATASQIMEENDTRHLAVVTAKDDLVGIISDRDCRLALQSPYAVYQEDTAENFAKKILVSRFMTRTPHVIQANASVQEAARIMLDSKISALPVMDGETLVGIITTTDVLRFVSGQPVA